jgi:hypothetical protein
MMTIQATKFTPEVLLSAPRRSAGIPNSTGEKVLYTVSPDVEPRLWGCVMSIDIILGVNILVRDAQQDCADQGP